MKNRLERVRNRLRPAGGQTIVDLALLTPIVVLLLMGVLDFSIAVARSGQLTHAVHEGVSYARQAPDDTTNIHDHVQKASTGLGIATTDITVTCYVGLTATTQLCSAANFGDSVRVQAIYRYRPLTGRLATLLLSPGQSTLDITQAATSEVY